MKGIGNACVSWLVRVLVNVGAYAAAFGLVVAACFTAFSLFGDVSGGEMDIPTVFSVDTRLFDVTAPTLGIEHAELESIRGSGNLKFAVPNRAFLATAFGGLTLWLAMVLAVLHQLRAVFRTLREGHPFVAANATRIRRTAYIVILGELARYGLTFVGNHYAMRYFSADGLRFDVWPDLNATTIVTGLIILVIAEVFEVGTRLDEEQSLTV
jgi:hypothetical protein